MYLYSGLCYSDAASVYRAMAASCPPVSQSGQPIVCVPQSDGYTVQVGSSEPYFVAPYLIPCEPEISDVMQLSFLVVAALASVYAVRLLYRLL